MPRPHATLVALGLVTAFASACDGGVADGVEGSSAAVAARGAYRLELLARSVEDPWSEVGTFRLPAGAAIKNASPSTNARGDVSISFRAADGLQHVWKNGEVVHDVPDPKAVVSRTSINGAGDVAFDVMGADVGNGVYLHAGGETTFFSSEPLGADSWINLHLLDDGRVGCRAGAGGDRRFVGFVEPDAFVRLALETTSQPSSPYAYLFTPSFDASGAVALKVMLAGGGHEIRVLRRGAEPVVIARDRAADASSPFAAFDNGVALAAGQVAFVAKEGARRGVYRSDGVTTTRIAAEGDGDVAQIAWFTPAMNAAGRVVFKGEDTRGHNAIWVGDGARLDRVVTAGAVVPSARGEATPLPETDYDPTNRVAFGGGVAIDAAGRVVFLAALAQRSGVETKRLGTALYVAAPVAPAPR